MFNKVAAFYQFRAVPDAAGLRAALEGFCRDHGVFGTVIVAAEGINGTIAGADDDIDAVIAALETGAIAGQVFDRLAPKFSRAGAAHFDRLKIRHKPEIVTLDRPEADPLALPATSVAPADWNALLDDPDVTIIDARKGFEAEMGSFPGALNTRLTGFRQFPDFVAQNLDPAIHKKIAMFCTGGIRCEKAGAYMRAAGFEQVLQLQGGILKYLEDVPASQSRWEGECFVFDLRIALGQDLVIAETGKPNLHPNLLDSARGSIAECT
jgi:UPF0176 protein